MTKETFPKTVESAEYDFVLINGLKAENDKLKEAINEVLELLDGKGVPNTTWIKNRLSAALLSE
jgi:hypothetical protein